MPRSMQRERRALPQLDLEPAGSEPSFGDLQAERWITPAPDAQLFPDPATQLESRESVALAFVALLQRVPPKQRAALLLKDVLGWSAQEIADTLQLSVPAVSSALHRARSSVASGKVEARDPSAETLRAFVHAWESRDLEALVALLREDVALAMPPYPLWFSGREAVLGFLQSPRFSAFWSSVGRVGASRANGLPALAFYRVLDAGNLDRHSVMLVRFAGDRAIEMTTFVGADYFRGFDFSSSASERFLGSGES